MSSQDHKLIELEIIALSHSVTQSQNYAVVLGETEGNRRLPIVIGGYEAQAIAVVLERMTPNRPLTHDLFKNALSSFGIEVKEILINNLLDGIFFSQLICEKKVKSLKLIQEHLMHWRLPFVLVVQFIPMNLSWILQGWF